MDSKKSRFSTIINSIDTDLTIIIDNDTGFYNITKINNYIYEQKCKQNESAGIPASSKKKKVIGNVIKGVKKLLKAGSCRTILKN
jgi:hypothetical protein